MSLPKTGPVTFRGGGGGVTIYIDGHLLLVFLLITRLTIFVLKKHDRRGRSGPQPRRGPLRAQSPVSTHLLMAL